MNGRFSDGLDSPRNFRPVLPPDEHPVTEDLVSGSGVVPLPVGFITSSVTAPAQVSEGVALIGHPENVQDRSLLKVPEGRGR